MTLEITKFRPPGPVAADFLQADDPIRFIMGPIGSGKTSTAFYDGVVRANAMPVCLDGLIRWRGLILRDTYANLYKTVIRSWHDWFPPDVGNWNGGDGRPASHILVFDTPRGAKLQVEMEFRALGELNIEAAARGWEGSWVDLGEADTMPREVLTYFSSRVGRYPAKRLVRPEDHDFWRGVVGDLNAPDYDHWIVADFVEEPREGHMLFRQPSGLSAQAENLHNLPPGYYERLAAINPEWWVRRFIHNQFGYSREGEPVYPEFDDARHVAATDLEPIDGPLYLGFDAALHPALTLSQRTKAGQWRTIDELVPGRVGATRFSEMARALLKETYHGLPIAGGWTDPTSFHGADQEGGELAWVEVVSRAIDFPLAPAPSNELSPRLEAVRQELTYWIDPQTPGYLLSPRCKLMRKGYNSGYRYRRIRVGNTERFEDRPEKNDYSHPHDAEQYKLLGFKGRTDVISGGHRKPVGWTRPPAVQVAQHDFDVFKA